MYWQIPAFYGRLGGLLRRLVSNAVSTSDAIVFLCIPVTREIARMDIPSQSSTGAAGLLPQAAYS
jgi:hypothetical protein